MVHLVSTVGHALCDFGPGTLTRGNKGMNKGQTHRHGRVGRGPPHPAAAACLLGTTQREVMQSLMEASVGEQSLHTLANQT